MSQQEVPELTRSDVEITSEWHYYDGPLEGILLWNGSRYWFSARHDDETWYEYGDVLDVMVLTPEDWARVDEVERQMGLGNYSPTKPRWFPSGDVVGTIIQHR